MKQNDSAGVEVISEAVQRWFQFYEIPLDDAATSRLCDAAVELYGKGYKTVDEIAAALIGTFVGIWSTRVNALSSPSMH